MNGWAACCGTTTDVPPDILRCLMIDESRRMSVRLSAVSTVNSDRFHRESATAAVGDPRLFLSLQPRIGSD